MVETLHEVKNRVNKADFYIGRRRDALTLLTVGDDEALMLTKNGRAIKVLITDPSHIEWAKKILNEVIKDCNEQLVGLGITPPLEEGDGND